MWAGMGDDEQYLEEAEVRMGMPPKRKWSLLPPGAAQRAFQQVPQVAPGTVPHAAFAPIPFGSDYEVPHPTVAPTGFEPVDLPAFDPRGLPMELMARAEQARVAAGPGGARAAAGGDVGYSTAAAEILDATSGVPTGLPVLDASTEGMEIEQREADFGARKRDTLRQAHRAQGAPRRVRARPMAPRGYAIGARNMHEAGQMLAQRLQSFIGGLFRR